MFCWQCIADLLVDMLLVWWCSTTSCRSAACWFGAAWGFRKRKDWSCSPVCCCWIGTLCFAGCCWLVAAQHVLSSVYYFNCSDDSLSLVWYLVCTASFRHYGFWTGVSQVAELLQFDSEICCPAASFKSLLWLLSLIFVCRVEVKDNFF